MVGAARSLLAPCFAVVSAGLTADKKQKNKGRKRAKSTGAPPQSPESERGRREGCTSTAVGRLTSNFRRRWPGGRRLSLEAFRPLSPPRAPSRPSRPASWLCSPTPREKTVRGSAGTPPHHERGRRSTVATLRLRSLARVGLQALIGGMCPLPFPPRGYAGRRGPCSDSEDMGEDEWTSRLRDSAHAHLAGCPRTRSCVHSERVRRSSRYCI